MRSIQKGPRGAETPITDPGHPSQEAVLIRPVPWAAEIQAFLLFCSRFGKPGSPTSRTAVSVTLQATGPSVAFPCRALPQCEEGGWTDPSLGCGGRAGAGPSGPRLCSGEREAGALRLRAGARGEAVSVHRLHGHMWLGKCGSVGSMQGPVNPGCAESVPSSCAVDAP